MARCPQYWLFNTKDAMTDTITATEFERVLYDVRQGFPIGPNTAARLIAALEAARARIAVLAGSYCEAHQPTELDTADACPCCEAIDQERLRLEAVAACTRAQDQRDTLRQRLVEAQHDIIAYLGALGHTVPGSHDGRLSDGTVPQCRVCNALQRQLAEAQAHVVELKTQLDQANFEAARQRHACAEAQCENETLHKQLAEAQAEIEACHREIKILRTYEPVSG